MALLREIDATHSPHVTAPEALAALLQGDRNRPPSFDSGEVRTRLDPALRFRRHARCRAHGQLVFCTRSAKSRTWACCIAQTCARPRSPLDWVRTPEEPDPKGRSATFARI